MVTTKMKIQLLNELFRWKTTGICIYNRLGIE